MKNWRMQLSAAVVLPLALSILTGCSSSTASSGCGSLNQTSTDVLDVAGTAPGSADLFEAIRVNSVGQPRLGVTLFFITHLEPKPPWNPSSISIDGAWGAYQIQHPGVVHPDITTLQALNPAYATNYMLPAYKHALRFVDPNLWVTDPEQAAEKVAYSVEKPKYDYYVNRARDVHISFQAAVDKMRKLGIDTNFASSPPGASVGPVSAIASSANCTAYGAVGIGAASSVVSWAQKQLNLPYVFGGGGTNGPSSSGIAHGNFSDVGFDCSGLTQFTFGKVGISLPRTAATQWFATRSHQVSPNQVQAGDLIFFGPASNPGHVGIVVDPAKTIMISAPRTGRNVSYDDYTQWGDIVGFTRPV